MASAELSPAGTEEDWKPRKKNHSRAGDMTWLIDFKKQARTTSSDKKGNDNWTVEAPRETAKANTTRNGGARKIIAPVDEATHISPP